MQEKLKKSKAGNIKIMDFITKIDFAYSIADVIISRAGAIAISELCIIGKPVIMVPSPNVAEDHQMKNALSLAARNAALIINDADAENKLIPEVIQLINNEKLMKSMSENCKKLGIRDSAARIADEVYKILK